MPGLAPPNSVPRRRAQHRQGRRDVVLRSAIAWVVKLHTDHMRIPVALKGQSGAEWATRELLALSHPDRALSLNRGLGAD